MGGFGLSACWRLLNKQTMERKTASTTLLIFAWFCCSKIRVRRVFMGLGGLCFRFGVALRCLGFKGKAYSILE